MGQLGKSSRITGADLPITGHFGVSGFGFSVQGVRFRVWRVGSRASGNLKSSRGVTCGLADNCGVWGFGLSVEGSRCGVSDFRFGSGVLRDFQSSKYVLCDAGFGFRVSCFEIWV